jgi:hypothetical protein
LGSTPMTYFPVYLTRKSPVSREHAPLEQLTNL